LGIASTKLCPVSDALTFAIIYSSGSVGIFVPISIVGYNVAPVKGTFVGVAPGPLIRSPLTGTRIPLIYTPVFCLGIIVGLARINGTGGAIVVGTPGIGTNGPAGLTSIIGRAAPNPTLAAIAAPYMHVVGNGIPPIGVGL
jgi:hypothetical protein